ncbi:hypothetical protein [Paremcibacter congregatus]|uniref:hypothetical protein n=1 Tax=Paremcibacter congregatus TaxID=2043170 RepID=UPI0030ED9674
MIRKEFKYRALCVTAVVTFLSPGVLWAAQEEKRDLQQPVTEAPGETTTPHTPAQHKPRSILFPSGEPGPYIPAETTDLSKTPVEQGDSNQDAGQGNSSDEPIIETMELNAVEPAAMGLIGPVEGGFTVNLWQGSERKWIEKWLGQWHVPTKSPVLAQLTERLLLSAAAVPGNTVVQTLERGVAQEDMSQEQPGGTAFPAAEKPQDNQNFLALRIEKISETGQLENLVSFLNMLPPESYAGSHKISDLMLMSGNVATACSIARQHMEEMPVDPYWLKLLAYCQAMEGRGDSAGLTIELLMEQGNTDFVFFDLINKLSFKQDEEGIAQDRSLSSGLSQLDPLTYSLLSVLEQPIDTKLFAEASPVVLYALASNVNVPKEERFLAAAESYRRGTYPVDKLTAHYNSLRFSAEEYENAISIARGDDSALGDALLYQAAAKQINDQYKAEMLREIWNRAVQSQDMARVARLNARTVNSLAPSDALLQHAHHISRGLLLAGNDAKAQAWFDFVRTEAYNGNSDATRALMDIWPMLILSGEKDGIPWSREILDLWWNGQMVLSPDQRAEKAGLFYSIAEALGFNVPEELWQELTGPLTMQAKPLPVALWRRLIAAAAEKRTGEVVLLGLMAAGENDPWHLDPTGVSALIRALRSVGLEKEARQLGLEIMANNGF